VIAGEIMVWLWTLAVIAALSIVMHEKRKR
jgi:hypothetical protein